MPKEPVEMSESKNIEAIKYLTREAYVKP